MKHKKFEYLEHTADAYVAAYGRNLEEAFENAAMATINVMTDLDKIEAKDKKRIIIKGRDEHSLLYNWLEEILLLFEIEDKFYSKIKVLEINEDNRGYFLKAEIWGETYNPTKHSQKVGVKAVTYHLMSIEVGPDQVKLKFILDI
jgi:SHS2 domain-containing protein